VRRAQEGRTARRAGSNRHRPAPAPEAAPAEVPKGDPVVGKDAFIAYCSACHGPDAKGRPNLGKDLTASQFFGSKTDAELIEYVKRGGP